MVKKIISLIFTVILILNIIPINAEGFEPVVINDEESVKEFAKLYMEGNSFERLYSMFDEVLVKHYPLSYFSTQLKSVEALTGKFVSFGNYKMIDNGLTHTHILNLNFEHKVEVMMLTMGSPYYSKELRGTDFSTIHGLLFAMTDPVVNNASEDGEKLDEQKYKEQEITIGNTPWSVEATVLIPEVEGKKVPAFVLVQGSGDLDRDATFQAVTPMKDIAEALALNGIASIRFDKRTLVNHELCTPEYYESFTINEDLIDDAHFATEAIKGFEEIDSSKIFLLGHDLGANISPQIAKTSTTPYSGIIAISGTPINMLDIIKTQNLSLLNKLQGEELQKAINEKLPEIEKAEKISDFSEEEAKKMQVFGRPMYYFYDMQKLNMGKIASELSIPMLILQGGRDFQINNEIGYNSWKKALSTKENVKYKKYPMLNHMMMEYKGDLAFERTIEEYTIPATVDNEVINDILLWVQEIIKE